jgi:septation ring formation regulator EzrA
MIKFILIILAFAIVVYLIEIIGFAIYLYRNKTPQDEKLEDAKYIIENKEIHSKIEIQKAQQYLDMCSELKKLNP